MSGAQAPISCTSGEVAGHCLFSDGQLALIVSFIEMSVDTAIRHANRPFLFTTDAPALPVPPGPVLVPVAVVNMTACSPLGWSRSLYNHVRKAAPEVLCGGGDRCPTVDGVAAQSSSACLLGKECCNARAFWLQAAVHCVAVLLNWRRHTLLVVDERHQRQAR
jgi:hypothetical protein